MSASTIVVALDAQLFRGLRVQPVTESGAMEVLGASRDGAGSVRPRMTARSRRFPTVRRQRLLIESQQQD